MLGWVEKTGQFFYRLWFYILVALPIIVFLPFIILLVLSGKTYKQFFWLARNIWATVILYGMGCFPQIEWEERLQPGKSYMLVANHTSILDIMLMLRTSKNPFVFVGKKELENIPIFGFIYRRVCILVDRQDSRSRTAVYRRAQKRLNRGLSICIFPEGGVPDEAVVLDQFKDGAFKMAIAHEIPVVPMTFLDNKKRLPFRFFSGGPGPLRVRVHRFLQTKELGEAEKVTLREKARNLILKDLTG